MEFGWWRYNHHCFSVWHYNQRCFCWPLSIVRCRHGHCQVQFSQIYRTRIWYINAFYVLNWFGWIYAYMCVYLFYTTSSHWDGTCSWNPSSWNSRTFKSYIVNYHCYYFPGVAWRHGISNNRADSTLAPSQWETSLQSNAVSHWLGANLESAMNYNICLVCLK